jgi:hypothetical protein
VVTGRRVRLAPAPVLARPGWVPARDGSGRLVPYGWAWFTSPVTGAVLGVAVLLLLAAVLALAERAGGPGRVGPARPCTAGVSGYGPACTAGDRVPGRAGG